MTLQALGYLGVRSRNLEDWAAYGTRFLGLQLVERTRSRLAFRMDDRKQRIVVEAGEGGGIGCFGWELQDAGALDALAARLEAAAVRVTRPGVAVADERRVKELISFCDPAGNRIEAFYGAEDSSEVFRPGRAISGFRTGPLGMGHVVLTVDRLDKVMSFYQDVLGFAISDYMLRPFTAYFFHINPRHHSLALIETGRASVHHLMIELYSLDDVGQGYDLALAEQNRIATTLGRHTNDYMTSFYSHSPSDFLIEYGWGGRLIDPANWQASELTYGPSLWGHDRQWLGPEQRAEARALRRQAAAEGRRAPVQVIEGNYQLSLGTCPWWDALRRRPA